MRRSYNTNNTLLNCPDLNFLRSVNNLFIYLFIYYACVMFARILIQEFAFPNLIIQQSSVRNGELLPRATIVANKNKVLWKTTIL